MEYSTEGVSVTDSSLPNLTNISDILSCTNDKNGVKEVTTSLIENNAAESNTIIVTAEVHSVSLHTIQKPRHPEVASVTNKQAHISNKLIPQPVSHNIFDKILSFPDEDIISTREDPTLNDILLALNLTLAGTTDDRAIKTFGTISPHPAEEIPMDIGENVTVDDTLSPLHLTGTGVGSYLEGSLVSLDDVVVIPPPKNMALSETGAFSTHLFIPDPPQRAKPKQSKTPAAISSGARRKFYEAKENLKAEKQANILKRKEDRAEAANQKKLKRNIQPQARCRSARNKKSFKRTVHRM